MHARFFSSLNYSSVNEDWRTEAAALRLGADDRVLCVTGSGARPLDLLAQAPASIVAIDVNPAQNHLLALKVAAMRRLSFEEYCAFLGLGAGDHRWRDVTLQALAPELPPQTRAFWAGRRRLVRSGVLYEGRWERFYRRLAAVVQLLWPRVTATLFAFDDLEAQRGFVERLWSTAAWRAAFDVSCSAPVTRLCLGDPAFFAHPAVRVGRYLFERMGAGLRRWLARENFMVSLVLRGALPPADLPPHLTPGGFELIRSRLDSLSVVTAGLEDYVGRVPRGLFTRLSLSDVPSYLSAEMFGRLLSAVLDAARPGARLSIRQFLTRHAIPNACAARLVHSETEEARLAAEDRSFAYEFIVADVDDA